MTGACTARGQRKPRPTTKETKEATESFHLLAALRAPLESPLPCPAQERLEVLVRCPFCSTDDDRVVDSRPTDDDTAIRRRRACNQCGKRYTTYERVEAEEQLRVIKRDGRIELFDRRKLLRGLVIAAEKRPVTTEALEALVNRVHQQLMVEGRREVASADLGNRVMEELSRLDQVAYVRFASVYRQFKSLDDFVDELRHLIVRRDAEISRDS